MSSVHAAARRYKAGAPLSALDGVPYAVKDCTDALPYATAGGTTYVRPPGEMLHARLPLETFHHV